MTILVTGGTGSLGSDLVPVLRERGAETLIMSRRPSDAADRRQADLRTGSGLAAALSGVDTVVHLAAGRDQPTETRHLVRACEAAGVDHLVFVSIVGIDRIPMFYYRAKLAAERIVLGAAMPVTVLRTTQFHQLAAGVFAAQRWSPVLFAPRLEIQPIDTRVVGTALAELALGGPHGRVPDLGGPEVLTGARIADLYRAHRGWRRPTKSFSLLGRVWGGYAAGHHLVPGNRAGGRTFAEFLTEEGPRAL